MQNKKRLLSDEEVEYLAQAYLKLKKNPTYQNLSKTFQQYCDEFLDEELLAIKRIDIIQEELKKFMFPSKLLKELKKDLENKTIAKAIYDRLETKNGTK